MPSLVRLARLHFAGSSARSASLCALLTVALAGACTNDEDSDDQGENGTSACQVDNGFITYCMEYTGPTGGNDGCAQSGGTPLSSCPPGSVGSCTMSSGSVTYTAYFYGTTVTPAIVEAVCPGGTYVPGTGGGGTTSSGGGSGNGGGMSGGGAGGRASGSGGSGGAGGASVVQTYHAAQIAAGFDTCALTTEGKVMCWGKVPGGTTGLERNLVPKEISGIEGEVVAVEVGDSSSCAQTDSGELWCWGLNIWGQLGDGTITNRLEPVPGTALKDIVAGLSIGFASNCGLDAGSGAWCWGNNVMGQLGDGTTENSVDLVAVEGMDSGVQAVTIGDFHACALTSRGAVFCWGSNTTGQLGDDTTIDSSTPVPVVGLEGGVAQVVVSTSFSCALTDEGSVLCWGNNYHGLLGDRSQVNSSVPVPIAGLASGVVTIAASYNQVYALMDDGSVLGWGAPEGFPSKDRAILTSEGTPVPVDGVPSGVTALAAGADHACVIAAQDRVFCWGNNGSGALGDGTIQPRTTVLEVSGF